MAGATFWDRVIVNGGRPVAWLVATLILLPPLTASMSLAAYLGGGPAPSPGASVALGLVLGAALAVLVAALSLSLIIPELANPYEYRELSNRVTELDNELARLGAPKNSVAAGYAPKLNAMFTPQGLRWIAGHGYLTLWTQVHQAEEALFAVEDEAWLVAEANRDLLRLKDSKMPQADEFTHNITAAVKALSPAVAKHYLKSAPPDDPFEANPAKWRSLALLKLQEARVGINAYRQTLWDGLIRARNQFVRTLIVTTFITSVVVELIVGRGTNYQVVETATVLFLVGALVGLFARLQGQISSTSVEEDFGLDTAHLIAAPILSGIAAVIGVLLVSVLGLKIGTIGYSAANNSTLRAIFSLANNPTALIIAALFGLTPELLIRYLKSQSDKFEKGLQTSEIWGKTPPVTAP